MTSLSTKFQKNTLIESFPELVGFTGFTSIAANAFDTCSNLQSIDITGKTSLGNYAFRNCSHLATSSIDWGKIISIGDSAFWGTNIPVYIVLSKLTYSGNYWSRDTPLRRVYLPVYQATMAEYTWEFSPMILFDFGKNLTGKFRSTNYGSRALVLVLRGDDYSGLTILYPNYVGRVYVHATILDAFKTRFTSLASKTFVIGGEEWTSAYGSSDEWADYPDGKSPFEEQG